MSWYMLAAYVFLATTSISGVEYISRTTETVGEALFKSLPLVAVSQYCLYYIFSNGSSVMAAWIVFTIAMSASRIVNSAFFLREGLNLYWVAAGVAAMILAGICIKQAHN